EVVLKAAAGGAVLKPGGKSFGRGVGEMSSLRVTGPVQGDGYVYAGWGTPGYRLRLGETFGTAGISTPAAEMRLDAGGGGPFHFSMANVNKMSLHSNGFLELKGGRASDPGLRTGGYIHSDGYVHASWASVGHRLRMGEIYGAAGLYTPDREMRFDIGGGGQFQWSTSNANKMTLHAYGLLELQGTLQVNRGNTHAGGIYLGADGDIVGLSDGYASLRFTNGVRIHSANKGGTAVISLTASGQVHANALYINTAAGQIRTNVGHATDAYIANTDRAKALWVGTGVSFETGPRLGFYGDGNVMRAGQVWFTIGGDANPAAPGVHVERRTSAGYTNGIATLCDKDGNGRWNGTLTALAFTPASSREAKEQIAPFTDDALGLIGGVRVVSFAYRADEARQRRVGIVAEDTDPLFSGPQQKHFDLANTLGVLVRAVQQIGDRLERLEQGA
ncbi:MAG TPA: tail fiber domain-containing protein, partial [Longimicrobium sp.]